MKLLFCKQCQDIVALRRVHRACECGESGGKYLDDGLHAVVDGPCHLIGFANSTLQRAYWLHEDQPEGADDFLPNGARKGHRFEAFFIPDPCSTVERKGDD